jgi:hypothetical protein
MQTAKSISVEQLNEVKSQVKALEQTTNLLANQLNASESETFPQPVAGQNTVFQVRHNENVDVEAFLNLLTRDSIDNWVGHLNEVLWVMVDRQRYTGAPYTADFFAEFYYVISSLRDAFKDAKVPYNN